MYNTDFCYRRDTFCNCNINYNTNSNYYDKYNLYPADEPCGHGEMGGPYYSQELVTAAKGFSGADIEAIIALLESQIKHSQNMMIQQLSVPLEDDADGIVTRVTYCYLLEQTLQIMTAHAEFVDFLKKRDTSKDSFYMDVIQAIADKYLMDLDK